MAGLDDAAVEHTDGPTIKFHAFTQYPTGSEPRESISTNLNFEDLELNGNWIVRDCWTKKRFRRIFRNNCFGYSKSRIQIIKIEQKTISYLVDFIPFL